MGQIINPNEVAIQLQHIPADIAAAITLNLQAPGEMRSVSIGGRTLRLDCVMQAASAMLAAGATDVPAIVGTAIAVADMAIGHCGFRQPRGDATAKLHRTD